MRKKRKIFKSITAVLLACFVFDFEILYVNAGYNDGLSNATLVNDGTGEFYEDLDEVLWSLPEYVQDIITPFKITLVGDNTYIESHYKEYRYSSVVGITDFAAKEIYVEAYIDDSYEQLLGYGDTNYNYSRRFTQTIMVHEIGHVVDNAFGMASYDNDFGRIFYAEVYDFMDSDYFYDYEVGDKGGVYTSEEYFCTAFACYILRPDILLDTCPETYDYIKECESAYLSDHGYDSSGSLKKKKDDSLSKEEIVYNSLDKKISKIIHIFSRISVDLQ